MKDFKIYVHKILLRHCANLFLCIMIKILQELSDIPMEEIYERKLILNSRESILKFELEDFKKLKNLDFLNYLQDIIINRYKLEK